jgi:biopolymer transport protein ExbD
MSPSHRKEAIGFCLGVALLAGFVALLFGSDPTGGAAPAGSGRRLHDDATEFRIAHDGVGCEEPCRKDAHWSLLTRGRSLATPEELRAALGSDPSNKTVSERQVVIRGGESSPWGLVQRVVNECSKVGIYKIDWSVGERGSDVPLIQAWLPKREQLGGIRCGPVKDEIKVFMKYDPKARKTLRKVSNRGEVTSDVELTGLVVQMMEDFQKAGRTDVPVLFDPTADVPWKDIVHVMNICRKEKVKSFEFMVPFLEIERPKK